MNIRQNVSLKEHSTMRLGGDARYLSEASSVEELTELLTWAERTDAPVIVIGSGSNIVWRDSGFPGLVIVNAIRGFAQRQIGGTNQALFTISAGENWDEVVERTVNLGYSGIEKLSLIPGTAGAAPVQNIGAYGCEIKDTLVSVRSYDTEKKDFVTLTNEQCDFAYRSSIFNSQAKGRYIITSLTLKLAKTNPSQPFYASLQTYLDEHNVSELSPASIRKAVIAIRSSKLPDPAEVANNGSFFGNPIVSTDVYNRLANKYPHMPHWDLEDDKVKLSAAWLTEQAGFRKGYTDETTGMALWKDQALVLVNEHAKSTADLLAFKEVIVTAVRKKFGVTLEQEPELL